MAVFPTRVGVNRAQASSTSARFVFPTRVGVNRRWQIYPACPDVFPTRVGVNRSSGPRYCPIVCFPHPRGGEPTLASSLIFRHSVFPTRVGVNRPSLISRS